ncbi:unnamed protein product [Mytilus edulis]|uniref:BHLH domain-containing protein n=1 Tax=Mytilus edulis TaxID=6550 RepID=A0A8S3VGN8_MYTED|nr:unnamed protein product [Mytilus edulis]
MSDNNGTDNVAKLMNMNGDIDESAQLYIVQAEDDTIDKARKRMTHNSIEKKRKDKIRYWINKIGELLPPIENSPDKERMGRNSPDKEHMCRVSYWINKIGELLPPIENSPDKERMGRRTYSPDKERMGRVSYWINKIGELLPPIENSPDKERMGRSTLEIVETAWEYITQLKAQTTPDMTEDVQSKKCNSKTNLVMTGLEIQRLKTDIEKTKLERDRYVDIIRNAGLSTDMTPGIWAQKNVSPVLSAININNQDLDPKQKSNKNRKRNTISQQLENMKKQQEELTAPNIMQMNNQNMLMNQMQMMNNQMMMPNQAGFPQTFLPGQMTLPGQAGDKDQSSADLLQGAMQESGITPNSNSQTGTIEDLVTQHSSESALQTLASVASQNLVSGSTAVVTCQSVSLTNTSQSSSVTTVTTQSVNTSNPIMATGQMMQNNSTGLMPFVNGQQNFPGNMFQNQQGFNNPLNSTTTTTADSVY